MNEHNQTVNADIPPPVAMLQLIAGFGVSRAIYIAAKLGIADLLKDQPKSSEELPQPPARMPPRSTVCCARWLAWACSLKMSTTALP